MSKTKNSIETSRQASPLYSKVSEQLAADIRGGKYKANQKLPSERELCETFSTTRPTTREALLLLENEGIIYRLNRRGWFVSAPRIKYNPGNPEHFNLYVHQQGGTPHTRLLSTSQSEADEHIAGQLEIPVGEPIYIIRRCRFVDMRPIMIETLYIKAELCPNLLDISLERSFTEICHVFYKLDISRVSLRMHPSKLGHDEAHMLQVAPASPCLQVNRKQYDQYGRVIDFDHELWLHDVIEVDLELTPKPT